MNEVPPKAMIGKVTKPNPLLERIDRTSTEKDMAKALATALTFDPPPAGYKLYNKDLDPKIMYGHGMDPATVDPAEILGLWTVMQEHTVESIQNCLRQYNSFPKIFPSNRTFGKEGLGTKNAPAGRVPYGPATFFWRVAHGLGSQISDFTVHLMSCLSGLPGASNVKVQKVKGFTEGVASPAAKYKEELIMAATETQNSRTNLLNCFSNLNLSTDQKKGLKACLENYERAILSQQARQMRALYDSMCKLKKDNVRESMIDQLMEMIPVEPGPTQSIEYRQKLEKLFDQNYPNLPGFLLLALQLDFMKE